MGSGRYIGRVGVLAVTLGVGVAIAQPTGMAWAEDTTTADSAEAQTAEGVDTASSEPTTGSRDTAAADTGSTAPSQASTTTVTDGHTTTTVGGDGAPKVTISGTTIDTTDDEATLPTAKAKPTATVENRSPSRPSRQTEKPKRNPSLVSAPASAASPVAVSRGAAGTEVSQVRTQRPAAAPVAATVQVTGAPTVAADSAPLKTRVTQPAPAPVTSSTTLVSNVLDVVSTALLGGGPQSPVDSPAMWALLAVARSRFGQPASGQRVASVPAGAPLSTSESFTLAAVNQPPTTRYFAGYPNATTGVVTGSVTATDKDRDPLTFTGPAGGASAKGGTVVVDAKGKFTYTPTLAARHGAARTGATAADKVDTFTVTVDDGQGHTVEQAVTVKVSPLKVAATVNHTNPNTGLATGAVTTANAGVYTYKTTTSRKGTLSVAADGSFTYTPTAAARAAASQPRASAYLKTDTFTITVTDAAGKRTTARLTVAIAPTGHVNEPPNVADPVVGEPDGDGVVTGSAATTDPERDPLTYSGSTTTTKGSVVVNPGGSFVYTPTAQAMHNASASNAAATGADRDTFTVVISDGQGGQRDTEITVSILPRNDVPTGVDVSVGQPNQSSGIVTGTVTATDPNNDGLTCSGSTTTTKGNVTVNPGGGFTYTPNPTAMHNASATN
ncbi:Ig-like domain-containing protein, partial [Mycobacterium sp. 852014-52144_SCH5372336]|uniref:Ig-like domain-containing protein n=1 Tax=Mycobacterium sp. 852014-52144_SCH5372336 TaxID=1834115 RepID=UPI0018D485EE